MSDKDCEDNRFTFLPDGVIVTVATALLIAVSTAFLLLSMGRDPGPEIR